MARTITEIQAEIIAAVQGDGTLAGASSTSATAIWRLITYVIASAVWALETIFDAFKVDLIAQVEALRPHTLKWYQEKALAFQYGSDLPEDSDEYDNSALTEAAILAQKIIAQAAAVEESGVVKIKVAREVSGALAKLTSPQSDSLDAYFSEIKDAGVDLTVVNEDGDKVKIELDIYYDPLVLNSSGHRIDGTDNDVVKDAVKAYLRALPFNGWLVKSHLTDYLQTIDGVYVPEIRLLQAAKYDAVDYGDVDIRYKPFAGYLQFLVEGTDLVLTFISKDTL